MTAASFPLSFGQQRLWLIDQMRPGSAEYAVPIGWRLFGDVDPLRLRRAVAALIARHEVLRTRYVSADGVPGQIVDPPGEPEWSSIDLTDCPPGEREARLRTSIDEIAGRPFRLDRDWPLRARLFRLDSETHVLVLVQHHIAGDGWSIGLLARDLGELYRAEADGGRTGLAELPAQYTDFAAWQRGMMTGQVVDRHLGYWRERLAGLEPLELPTDRPRPSEWQARGGVARFTVAAPLGRAMVALGRAEKATPYMTFLAAVLVLLSRRTGRTDVTVGSPFNGRGRPDLEDLIGLFVNTVVIRADLADRPTFRQVLRRVRTLCLQAYEHQDLPFERLVEDLAPERELSRNPLFQIMFSHVAAERPLPDLPGVRTVEEPLAADSPMFDLAFELTSHADGGLDGLITYASSLYDQTTVEGVAKDLTQLMASAASQPDTAIGELPLLVGEDRDRVLLEWNRTAAPRPERCVHELIARQAQRTPDALAVVDPSEELTYRQLDQRANALAWQLRELGVGPESRVGVCVRRGVDLMVGLLAVLKSGGAYVPLDPAHPRARTRRALDDAGVSIVLTDPVSADGLAGTGRRLVTLDEPGLAADAPATGVGPDNLLYVLYTSGSTGRPKGTLITHRGMVNRALWGARHLGPADRVLQKTPLTFDAAGWEVWAPLVVGGTVVSPPPGVEGDPAALVRSLDDHAVTVLQMVPSMLRLLVEEPGFAECTSLRLVYSGGEQLTADVCARVSELLDVELRNLYGPTECTIDVTTWRYAKNERVAIGGPIENVQVFVMDEDGRPVPVGVPGELYVGGAGLARGYLARPALTAERFVPSEFGHGERLYRTGDRVRWLPGGDLEFLGRLDDQVKVGGVRIEPGEIEATLAGRDGITGVAVTARTDQAGDTFLVAHYEPAATPPAEMREFAAAQLPASMVPAQFVPLDRLPRTTSGKIDRKALPAWQARDDQSYVAPRTETERQVAGILAAALGVERVGLHDNFFRLGGHSLLAIRTVSRLRAELSAELPARLLFEAPTPEGIARAVRTAAPQDRVIPSAPRDVAPPASSGQRRLWFLDRLRSGASDYLVTVATRLRGPLDTRALRDAFREVVTRHEPLRTRCDLRGDDLVQLIDPPQAVPWQEVAPDPESLADGIEAFVGRVSGAGFRLGEEPPLRATLAKLADDDHVLVLAMHHIACDARSIEVITREISELYAHRHLDPLPVRFADFAAWERSWSDSAEAAAQLDFWRRRLDGAGPLELPTDRPRPPARDAGGAAVDFRVPAPLARALADIGRGEGATPFMTMLAAFDIVLARRAAQQDIVVGTTVTGRPVTAFDGLVGPFMNSVVLRVDLAGCTAFSDVLPRVRDSALSAFAHQDIPFERLVDELRPRRDSTRNPFFQVLFELEPYSPGGLRLDAVTTETIPVGRPQAKLDLIVHLDEQQDGSYLGSVEYAAALFDESGARLLADDFLRVVEHAAAAPEQRLPDLGRPEPAAKPVAYLVASTDYRAPETAAEQAVAEIFADVLGLDDVGMDDNFFDLGGHSLLAIEAQVQIQDEFDIDVPLRTLFDAPTVRALADVIERTIHPEVAPTPGDPTADGRQA